MLTQFQTTEPQVATLAACPRPRALAPLFIGAPAVASWPRPASRTAAAVRRPDSAAAHRVAVLSPAERPAIARSEACYAATRVLLDPVRVELGAGANGSGNGSGTAGLTMSGTDKQQDPQNPQQYEQHLTASREPVTWRPPH